MGLKNKMLPEIVLASSSKVRKGVMDRLGVNYRVSESGFKEKTELKEGESFEDLARRLALSKARDVALKTKEAIVIGADSFAVIDGEILGKPQNRQRAIEYLNRLNGKEHEFYTGIAVIDTKNQKEMTACVKAKVKFRDLTSKEIEDYIEREEVLTAGGAYRIQGLGSVLVERVEGDYYAIVGLSPSKVAELFKDLGHNLFDYIPPICP